MPKVLNLKSNKERYSEAIVIDRSTPWGNPYVIGIDGDRDIVCDRYGEWLYQWIEYQEEVTLLVGGSLYNNRWVIENLHLLKGRDVACWCSPLRCHGEILVELANR